MLPHERIDVRIAMDDDDRRVVEIAATGPAWAPRRAALDAALAPFGAA